MAKKRAKAAKKKLGKTAKKGKARARKSAGPRALTLKAPNGQRVELMIHPDGSSVLTWRGPKGVLLGRQCSGTCGNVSVGPIDCPEGKSPFLNCVANPPTISCV